MPDRKKPEKDQDEAVEWAWEQMSMLVSQFRRDVIGRGKPRSAEEQLRAVIYMSKSVSEIVNSLCVELVADETRN